MSTMPIWVVLLYPFIGAIGGHVIGACAAGLYLFAVHYAQNFNANPELISVHWDTLSTIGQMPAFGGFILGSLGLLSALFGQD